MSHSDNPAFPVPELNWSCGMTLRDYFAAKAMQGYCAREGSVDNDMGDIAADAYAIADAMLCAREN